MDEQRLERALRQGPPFATRYVPASLGFDGQSVGRRPGVGRLVLIIAVAALLLVGLMAGLAVVGTLRDDGVIRAQGEILVFQGVDLGARDPETGEVRKIVETDAILTYSDTGPENFVKVARWSPDGRWVAFEISFDSLDGMGIHGRCGPTAGVWVQGATGGPRQLTTPCEATPGAKDITELWTWSPDGDRLAYARIDADDDRIFLIDPSDGRRTLLMEGGGEPTAPNNHGPSASTLLAWSPDGSRIAYAVGGSIYELQVEARERSLLAGSFDDVMDIRYSPDGTEIMVIDHDFDLNGERLHVMNADGSDLHVVLEGETGYEEAAWSPIGDRILYQLSVSGGNSEVWTVSPDGSHRVQVFDSDGCPMGPMQDALPVWAPSGTQVAYNACGTWVVANADGTGEAQPVDRAMHRSWAGGGLSGWDMIGGVGEQ